jgi:hypothetical protein
VYGSTGILGKAPALYIEQCCIVSSRAREPLQNFERLGAQQDCACILGCNQLLFQNIVACCLFNSRGFQVWLLCLLEAHFFTYKYNYSQSQLLANWRLSKGHLTFDSETRVWVGIARKVRSYTVQSQPACWRPSHSANRGGRVHVGWGERRGWGRESGVHYSCSASLPKVRFTRRISKREVDRPSFPKSLFQYSPKFALLSKTRQSYSRDKERLGGVCSTLASYSEGPGFKTLPWGTTPWES